MKAYEQAGYDFARDDANWQSLPSGTLYDETGAP